MAAYWNLRGRTDDRKRYLPLAVAAAQRVAEATGTRDDRLRADAWRGITATCCSSLAMSQPHAPATSARLAVMQAVGDQREEGVALSKLGDLALREGDVAAAAPPTSASSPSCAPSATSGRRASR